MAGNPLVDGPLIPVTDFDVNRVAPILGQVVDILNLGGIDGAIDPTGTVLWKNLWIPRTSSPGVTGQVWNNNGVLTISNGPGT